MCVICILLHIAYVRNILYYNYNNKTRKGWASDMKKAYSIRFTPHRRTSLLLEKIPSSIVYANNKESAKELGQAIVRDFYNGNEYMVRQYKYVIEKD